MEKEFAFYKKIVGIKKLWLRFGLLFVFIIFIVSIVLEVISILKFGRITSSFVMLFLFYLSLFFLFLIIYGIPAFVIGAIVGLVVEWLNK